MTFIRNASSLPGLNPILRAALRVAGAVVGLAGAVLGLALFVAVMLFALVMGTSLLLWAKLRGRRAPDMRFAWQNLRRQRGPHHAQASRPQQATQGVGQIVDIEAREIKP